MANRPPAPPVEVPLIVNGRTPQVWLDYFNAWHAWMTAGVDDTFTNADGDTVTVGAGLITDIS